MFHHRPSQRHDDSAGSLTGLKLAQKRSDLEGYWPEKELRATIECYCW